MSESMRGWTTQDLELYYDGELDAQRRTELNDALRRDPGLRERFATVCRVDDGLRAAFLVEGAAQHDEPQTVSQSSRQALAAACLLIAAGLTWWFGFGRDPSRETSLAQRAVHTYTIEKPEYRSIRVVLSLPTHRTTDRPIDEHEVQATVVTARQAGLASSPENFQGFLARLDGTLIAGRIEDTLDLLEVASKNQRTVAYLRLGELLRSANTAERILERLDPQEQLTVCGLWAREPVAQPIVFERLRRFSTQPDLSDDVRAIVSVLSEDPGLRPWLQGYQLVNYSEPRLTGEAGLSIGSS